MPKKRPSLDAQLSKQTQPAVTTSVEPITQTSKQSDKQTRIHIDTPTRTRAKARVGKKAVSGFYEPEVAKQLKQIALDEDKTVQAVLGEALNLLFVKYGKDAIASES